MMQVIDCWLWLRLTQSILVMKLTVKSVIVRSVHLINALKVFRGRPKETRWTIIGGLVGAVAGFIFIGGVGIAAMGTAFGVPAALIGGVLGCLIGNRFGISRDRPVNYQRKSD